MMKRRRFVRTLALTAAGWAGTRYGRGQRPDLHGLKGRWAQLEKKSGGRLGVFVLDTATGATAGYRDSERFPMCSTFKVLAVSALLADVDAGKKSLDHIVHFTKEQLVAYSPITEKHAGAMGISLRECCEAAITLSDNTAANLILGAIGGPSSVTSYARSLGDTVTRLDRNEPSLNESLPGDPRDTTYPAAMGADLRTLILGDALKPASRDQLTAWLIACQTGGSRLRAGLPADWKVADKTGTGDRGTANDIAVVWPPNRGPITIASYLTGSTLKDDAMSAIHAEVGRSIAAAILH